MELDKLRELYKKYNLTANDVYKHKHYVIITRPGIDKIQAVEKINIHYDVEAVKPDFAAVKATASMFTKPDSKGFVDKVTIQTFGSAKYGGKEWNEETKKYIEHGNSTTWYILEMAEKRAMSRAVLKLTGFYELGVFGEDEAEDFKKSKPTAKELINN